MFQLMKWLFLLGAALIVGFVLYLSIMTIRKIRKKQFLDLLFTEPLYNTKILLISIILTFIFSLLLLARKIYKQKLTFSKISIYSSFFLLIFVLVSLLIVNQFGKFTYVLFVAGVITVIYSEISFLLGKYFFPNFVSENVSKEIIYMFSFIVFINVGYFTFMLILDILKAESVY